MLLNEKKKATFLFKLQLKQRLRVKPHWPMRNYIMPNTNSLENFYWVDNLYLSYILETPLSGFIMRILKKIFLAFSIQINMFEMFFLPTSLSIVKVKPHLARNFDLRPQHFSANFGHITISNFSARLSFPTESTYKRKRLRHRKEATES